MKKIILIGLILLAVMLKCISTRVILSQLEDQKYHAAKEELVIDEK